MLKITTTRRGFMQLGTASAAALTLGGSLAALTGCSKAPAASGYKVLRDGDIPFFTAIAPVMLNKSYPGTLADQAPERLLHSLDELMSTLQDYAQSQLLMLLDVMQVAPLRAVMGAPWASWEQTSHDDIDAFLQSWKDSSLQLKRMGYGSLCKLVSISWYSQPETFAASGYPGPPKKIPA